jgi:hypothetical protein
MIGRIRFGPVKANSMEEAAKVRLGYEVINMDDAERILQVLVGQDTAGIYPFTNQFEWSGDEGEVLVDPIILKEDYDPSIDYEKSTWFTINGEPILYHGQAWQVAQNAIIHVKRALDLMGDLDYAHEPDIRDAQNTLRNFINLYAMR